MAKAPLKNDKKAKSSAKDPLGTMRLVRLAGLVLSILAGVVLFAALFDLGFIDLRFELRDFALVALAVMLAGVVAIAYSGPRITAGAIAVIREELEAARGEIAAQNAAMEEKVEAQVAAADHKVEKFLGAEYERLKAENEAFRKEIEQQRSVEMSRTSAEIEQLRQRNEMLQEKISKWAIDSVDSVVMHDRIHEA